ncbi:MAG: prephenate dehydrogenase [bacterium]|nr:prephenate dehydrogenase [bacterium]
MNITVVGLGLIGGSLALSLKESGFAKKIIGVDNKENHTSEALELNLVDECQDLETAIANSDLILIAIPVNAIVEILPKIMSLIDLQIVMDFGSTKEAICETISNHPKREQFVAAHPMAGTENTGPSAALSGLYSGKVNIICEKDKSSERALKTALKLFQELSMNVIYMDPVEHDKHIAYVSHLSHISSFMLGMTVLDIEKDEKNIFNMAGSGFQSTVRLAMSSPEMWAPIFNQNSKNVKSALTEYIRYLQIFKEALEEHNSEKMLELMKEANDIRRVLKK